MHLKLTDKHSNIELLIPVKAIYVEADPGGGPVRIGVLGRGGSYRRAGDVETTEPLMIEVKETLSQISDMLNTAKRCDDMGIAGVVSAENEHKLFNAAKAALGLRSPHG